MMIAIPDVLDAETLARVRAIIDAAPWVDGNVTSGYQSALAKRNMQLPEDSAAAREAGAAFSARVLAEYLDSRINWGKGRGVDRGFDATVSAAAEKIRTSLPDRNTANPDYRDRKSVV